MPYFDEINLYDLFRNCFSSNYSIADQAWKLVALIFKSTQEEGKTLPVSLYGAPKLIELLEKGLISVQPKIRSISCQIMTNNLEYLFGVLAQSESLSLLQ